MHAPILALVLAGGSHFVDPLLNQSPLLEGTAWKPQVELVLVDSDALTKERRKELEAELTTRFATELKQVGLDPAPKERTFTPTVLQRIVLNFTGNQVVYSCHTTAHARLPKTELMGVVWMDAIETQRSPELDAKLRGDQFGWLLSICAKGSATSLAKAVRINAKK